MDDMNQDAEPKLRMDVYADLGRVEIGPSEWQQAPYAQWVQRDDGAKVLRLEPLTVGQIHALEDALADARRRFAVAALDRARDAKREATA